MSEELEFQAWPKIGRVSPFSVVISEKMDGTNGCIVIRDGKLIAVQSRKRFIVEGDDNYWYINDRQKPNPLKTGRQKTAILA